MLAPVRRQPRDSTPGIQLVVTSQRSQVQLVTVAPFPMPQASPRARIRRICAISDSRFSSRSRPGLVGLEL